MASRLQTEKYCTMSINVTKSSLPPFDEYLEEIRDIWESHILTNMGPKHRELQARLQRHLGVEKIELVTNGHMALELSLQAMGLSGEVITSPFTFASTTHAIVRNGLKPVFCDINPNDYTIDASKVESLITNRTCAIVPIHVYGNICDVEEIDNIASKYGLKVIYDAAHAFGESYKGKGVGAFGDASCFSFHATKVFNTIEGGAVCFSDPEFGERLYQLKNFGIKDEETVNGVGANAKMNEFSAAMGICNLRHISQEIAKRRVVVERYREKLWDVKGIRMCVPQDEVTYNYAYFPIVIDPNSFGVTRDEVYKKLKNEGINARKYFYPLTSAFDCYKESFDPNDTPVAYKTSKRILTLPLYADLDLKVVDRICRIIYSLKSRP